MTDDLVSRIEGVRNCLNYMREDLRDIECWRLDYLMSLAIREADEYLLKARREAGETLPVDSKKIRAELSVLSKASGI